MPGLLPRLIRLSVGGGAFNLVVANVPGPDRAIALPGGVVTELYPVVPPLMNHTLGIALFSFDGALCWGFHADRQAVPDLPVFVGLIREEFEALHAAACAVSEPPLCG